ncbi:MAG: transcriptional regulator [Saccharofermentanales bacterium]|jgi:hypothetical protein|nr:transcriptional regulator [Bacillota bacterium]
MALIDVKEVMKITKTAESTAYQLMRKLNEEMRAKGYITLRGKIERTYLLERLGIPETDITVDQE